MKKGKAREYPMSTEKGTLEEKLAEMRIYVSDNTLMLLPEQKRNELERAVQMYEHMLNCSMVTGVSEVYNRIREILNNPKSH